MMLDPAQLVLPKEGPVLQLTNYGVRRLVAVGDVHGCALELAQLLVAVELAPEDLLVFLGDYVDRGPQGAEAVAVVQRLVQDRPLTYAVRGNHDEKHIRWRRHLLCAMRDPAYQTLMRMPRGPYLREHWTLSDEQLVFLAGLPVAVDVEHAYGPRGPRERSGAADRTIFTHAGVHPYKGLAVPASNLIRMCFVKTGSGKQVAHRYDAAGRSGPPPGAVHWTELYTAAERVVYGHSVLSKTDPVVRGETYGIDTGCVSGGRLTAYVEDAATSTVTYKQVTAPEHYAKNWHADLASDGPA